MNCPHCRSANTSVMKSRTNLGYKQYRCKSCYRQYNERSGSQLNFVEYPTEVVVLAVHYYYRFKVSLDDVVELMLLRGITLSHQTVHNWVQTFGINLGIKLRKGRKGKGGKKWHMDPTYIKVEGRWCYLYRAIDKEGNLIDVLLSNVRDDEAAIKFFKQAKETCGILPTQITTDKEKSLGNGITANFSNGTKHRTSKYMNNRIEQDHRAIKSRYKPMKVFKEPFAALIFCTAFEEIRQFLRMKKKSRSQKRSLMPTKIHELHNLLLQQA